MSRCIKKNHKYKCKCKCCDSCEEMTDPKPKKILLECGHSLELARFDLLNLNEQVFSLGRVIVDASCLHRPEVKIEFSSIVSFQNNSGVRPGVLLDDDHVLDFRLAA